MHESANAGKRMLERLLALFLLAISLITLAVGDFADPARSYTEIGFHRALRTYATARGSNALISVAQSAELSIEPAGIGGSLSPSEILDPVNDLVGQF